MDSDLVCEVQGIPHNLHPERKGEMPEMRNRNWVMTEPEDVTLWLLTIIFLGMSAAGGLLWLMAMVI